jgi:hypothetical protein
VDEKTIKEVAKQSYLNGTRDYRFFKKLTTEVDPTLSPDFNREEYTTSMIENVLTKNGQNWFEKTKYSHDDNRISFSGMHDMGENFSIFIKELLILYMNEINFEIHNTQTRKIKNREYPERPFSYIRYDFIERK